MTGQHGGMDDRSEQRTRRLRGVGTSFASSSLETARDLQFWACGDAKSESTSQRGIAPAPCCGLLTCSFSLNLLHNKALSSFEAVVNDQEKAKLKFGLQRTVESIVL